MNRNVESHFSQLPSIDIQRSIFDRSSTHKTSFNAGELIPIYVDEVLPGDSFQMTTSKVVRAQTMLTPIMDNIYLDTYFFFVPMRLVWTHAKEFFGENNTSAWVQTTQYTIPSISAPSGGFSVNGIADYMGLPTGVSWNATDRFAPSALPFRAYALVCDQWFRDENLTDPLNIPTGDSNQTGTNGTSYINDVANGGAPFKVAKYHDYFTSALPSAQKSPQPVSFNLLNNNKAPVIPQNHRAFDASASGIFPYTSWSPAGSSADTNGFWVNSNVVTRDSAAFTDNSDGTISFTGSHTVYSPDNLFADLSASLGAITINDLRLAFQLQKFYEKQARGGTRYIEILKEHFGVTSPDARLQRSEYLGGNRIQLNVHEVTNSAQSTNDFLGDLGAKCATSDIHQDFEHSFSEHGYIIGCSCIRYDHSYPQGLERMWLRKSFEDFYFPVFANLGEMPIWDCQIYADATSMANENVFGYQEAWAEYRYKPDRVSGEMRPGIANTLASWHLADYYTAKPTLSDGWIREDKTNIDRTLAVTSAVSNQFFADFYFQCICTRCMPTYSIPGLIDHH